MVSKGLAGREIEMKTFRTSKTYSKGIAAASDYLGKPEGSWPETVQAYGVLTDAVYHAGRYHLPSGATLTNEEQAADAWIEEARREGARVHPSRSVVVARAMFRIVARSTKTPETFRDAAVWGDDDPDATYATREAAQAKADDIAFECRQAGVEDVVIEVVDA